MDNKMCKEILVKAMSCATDDIENINEFIFLYGDHHDFMFSMAGSYIECEHMMKCCIEHATEDMSRDKFALFMLELNMFAMKIEEERYGSDSE